MIAFSGCIKEEIKTPVLNTKTIQFYAESIETKTVFGTPDGTSYPTLWTNNDEKVHVSMNLSGSKESQIIPSEDFKTANFSAEITDDESGSYTFYSVSPASAVVSFNANYISYNIEIPTTQTPSSTSVDEKAQILVASSQTYSEFPSSVNLAYTHFTAYGKMSLKDLELGDAVVSSVTLTSNTNIAYRYYYYPETGTFEENGSAATITIKTDSVSDIWFACAPVDVSNTTMKVVVNTDRGTFTKEITFPDNRKFESGKISVFTVNMGGVLLEAPEMYELVTDPADLTAGSKVIIVGDTDAMSVNQKTNNRSASAVTLSEDKSTVSTPGADVQIFTVEPGTKPGTIAFNTGDGYIYAASSGSNHLKTKADLDDNASWKVTVSDGITAVVAQGENERNTLRYNPNNGSPLFSCYASTTGSPVSIYKLVVENYLSISPESVEVSADVTEAGFYVSSDLAWTASPSEGANVEIVDNNFVHVSFSANNTSELRTYKVTVTAEGVEDKVFTVIQAGKVEEVDIETVIAAERGEFKVRGVVVAKHKRGVLLRDETGVILAYAGVDPEVNVGDLVTVFGDKSLYGGFPQISWRGFEVISTGNPVSHPSPTVLTGEELDNLLTANTVSYIQYSGTLSVSSYYNVTVEGASTAVGSIQYPLDEFGVADMNGKKIIVTGYHVGTSSSKYLNTMLTSIEVIDEGDDDSGDVSDPNAVDYYKFDGELVEGDYLIVYENVAMKASISSDRLQYIDVTPIDNVISTPEASIVWTIAKSGDYWTIYNASTGKYAAGTGAKNKATLLEFVSEDGGASWESDSSGGTYEFVNVKNKKASVNQNLRRNGTYGFACYSTLTGGALTLYKKNQ